MKIALLFLTTFAFIVTSAAQEINVDKNTGLVKVDGKEAFYLVKKNKVLWSYDLSLQNLQNEELAYLAAKDTKDLPVNERSNRTGMYYLLTFSETANTSLVFLDGFNVMKNIAKQIVNGKLIKDKKIDPRAERMFVSSHQGKLFRDPESIKITVNTAAPVSTKSIDISVKGNNIYNNGELVGSFKKTIADGTTSINIYNSNDNKVAIATHNDNDVNADWNIASTSDNKKFQVLYTDNSSFDKLFKLLIEKGIL